LFGLKLSSDVTQETFSSGQGACVFSKACCSLRLHTFVLQTIDKSRGVRLKRLIRHVRSKFESRLAAVPMRTLSPWLRSLIQKLPPVSITAQRVLVRQQKGLQGDVFNA